MIASATVPIPDSLSGYWTSQTDLASMIIAPICYEAGMFIGVYTNNNGTMANFFGMYDELVGDKAAGTLGWYVHSPFTALNLTIFDVLG